MKDWYFLVLLGILGNLEGALKRERSAGSRSNAKKTFPEPRWVKDNLFCSSISHKG